tara:strand:- start:246 stop:497 length:252 start_codon:yes stop_codon:yes gene_type:complete
VGLTEVLEAAQEAALAAVHIEVLAIVVLLEVLVQQEVLVVAHQDLLAHLAEVAVEITKSKILKIRYCYEKIFNFHNTGGMRFQ